MELSEEVTVVTLSFNCLTFTASVSFSPALTLVIVLPPLSRPWLVNLTSVVVVPGVVGALIVIPSLFTTVLPIVTEPSLVRLRSLFILTVNVSPFSATTAILPAADLNS